MSGGTHYEVFFKKNRKAGWALFEACDDRDSALKQAHSLLSKNKDGSVRVTKEIFNPDDRTFRSIPVFEGGAEKLGLVEEKTGKANLPCLTPDDLAKPHARDTIRRTLGSWLERTQSIPMELLHRPDLVESLEAAGTELQHAVQKVAIATAQDNDASVHGIVKQLNELVQKSLTRIYKDARAESLPTYEKKQNFADVASAIFGKDSRPYTLRAAIADRLKREKKYSDKLDVLLDMTDSLPGEDAARTFALSEVDSCLAEVISFNAGLEALLGSCKDLGETLERLTCLYDGDKGADVLSLAPQAAKRMAEKINNDDLDACRGAIARTLMKELQRPKRLRPSSVREEIRLARDLAQKLVISSASAGSLMPLDELNKAFTARSARLLTPETIDELLRHSRDTDEEVQRLLDLEENMVGEANKRKLAGYVRSVIGSPNAQSHYIRGPGKPLERLAGLTAHQGRILRGGYPDEEKAALASSFDSIGMKIIDETKILNAVEAGDRPALDKATALLKLATAGALPVGDCSNDAQARALRQLKSAAGLSEAQTESGRTKLRGIQSMLQQVAVQNRDAA